MGTPTTDTTNAATSIVGRCQSEYNRVVRDEHRRRVIGVLRDRGTPIDLEELATAVAGRRSGAGAVDADGLSVSLHHVHLPMLDDAGFVDYDPETQEVDVHRDAIDLLDL